MACKKRTTILMTGQSSKPFLLLCKKTKGVSAFPVLEMYGRSVGSAAHCDEDAIAWSDEEHFARIGFEVDGYGDYALAELIVPRGGGSVIDAV